MRCEYNFPNEALMSDDDDLNFADRTRNTRLKLWEWIVYGAGVVSVTVMCTAMWNLGDYLSRNVRHGLMVFSWLTWTGFGLWRLMLMRRRAKMSILP